MDFDKARLLPRDSVLYALLRDALDDYSKEHEIANKYDYFAGLLGYESKTKGNQLLMSLMDVSVRKFSLDELKILLDTLGTRAAPFGNRLLANTGIVCSASDSVKIENINDFSILHLVTSGKLAKSLSDAMADGNIDKAEKVEIFEGITSLISFLSSLRETIEGAFDD